MHARFGGGESKKYQSRQLVGFLSYKVHLTETCEQTLPHLITHVATTPAPKTDEAMTENIQEELSQADLSPAEHFVDAGYVSARVLVKSEARFGIEVMGPVSVDTQWQAHCPSGIDANQFVLDWEHQRATCPQGKTSSSWTPISRMHHPDLIKIQFATTDCGPCPRRGASCAFHHQIPAANPDGQATGAAHSAPGRPSETTQRNFPAEVCSTGRD